MRPGFSLIVFLILTCLNADGQNGKFSPFRLIVVQPDTAIIDPSLIAEIDSIETGYIKRYYDMAEQLETLSSAKDSLAKTWKEAVDSELSAAKALEQQVKKFKYYHTLSAYSVSTYNFYFNEYEPFSTILEVPRQNTDISSLKRLTDSLRADYVVTFRNIHTTSKDEMPLLKLTTSLYSGKENKIILEIETEGDANSRGDMWTCTGTTLSCLLINGVRTSTGSVANVIAKRQLRKEIKSEIK